MNAKVYASLVASATLFLAIAPAFAHHSPSSEFDLSKSITLTGKVSSVDWINPHVYVHLDVKDNQGKVTAWDLECLPTRFLHKAGVTKEGLMGADSAGQVVMTCSPYSVQS